MTRWIASSYPWVALTLAFWLQWGVLQVMTYRFRGTTIGWLDFRAILSAFNMALALALICGVWRARIWRWPLTAIVSVLHISSVYSSYENVMTLGDVVDFSFLDVLTDETFVKGSVLGLSHPWLVAMLFLLPLAVLKYSTIVQSRLWRTPIHILIACSILLLVWPTALSLPLWRQVHVWPANFSIQKQNRIRTADERKVDQQRQKHAKFFTSDLHGDSLVKAGGTEPRAPHIILITLESISQAFIGNDDQPEITPPGYRMENLTRLAQQGFSLTRFFAPQRQTHRGEYALLCGDFPNMVAKDAKMRLYGHPLSPQERPCLPRILRREGYRTVYMRSASLKYQRFDLFGVAAGFDEMYGRDFFKKSYVINEWGVDDLAFFEQSAPIIIERIQTANQPIFFNLLTVGTHHPFTVPAEWRGKSGADAYADTVQYLDYALGKFFDALASAGVLEQTLLIITADETSNLKLANPIGDFLSDHWIPMIVLGPNVPRGTHNEILAQPDLAISILDYLNRVAEHADKFLGRSIFRRYSQPRTLVWGNTYRQRVAAIFPDHTLTMCATDFSQCSAHNLNSLLEFPGEPSLETLDRQLVATMEEIVQGNDVRAATEHTFRARLVSAPE